MDALPFTLATYRVKDGREADFVRAWNGLADTFASLENPPYWGILLRSRSDRGLFHSFGPWESPAHVEAMRSSPAAATAFAALRETCDELQPDDYEVIRHVRVRQGGDL